MESNPVVAGLRNTGNTCYLNACLQAMASSPALVHHVLQLARLMAETQQHSEIQQPLMHQLVSSLRAAYRFLVQGPDDSQLTQEYLRAKAAQGQFTQQLADILAALQPRSAADSQQTSSTDGVTNSSATNSTKYSAVVDPSLLLSTLRWYIPEGVLDSGLEHDTAEAFQAVIDAVSIELTCWQQLHHHNSSSSPWQHSPRSGLKAIMQADSADVIRPVTSAPQQERAQQQQQQQQQSPEQQHQQRQEECVVVLQHPVSSAESCRRSSKLSNSCGHTSRNGTNQQQHPDAGNAVRRDKQSMTKQQQEQEQEEAEVQQPKQQPPGQQQQQPSVMYSRLPVIGHSIDLITCQSCGYRFPRSLTPFVCLPLLLPVSHTAAGDLLVPLGATLQHCMERNSRSERVDGVECLKCSLSATLAAAAAAGQCATASSATSRQLRDGTVDSNGTDDDKADLQPDGQQVHSNTQQQQLLADLSHLISLSAPLPPLNYQQLVQQAGFPWLRCHKTVTKQTRLARPPTVLVIQLQRCVHTAGGGQRKVQGHVGFPLVLDLAEYVFQEEAAESCSVEGQQQPAEGTGVALQQISCTTSSQLLYDCTAVVQHLGAGQASGHYIVYRRVDMSSPQQQQQGHRACCRADSMSFSSSSSSVCCAHGPRSSATWLRVNDSRVCPADEQEVLQCHATLLVYERQT